MKKAIKKGGFIILTIILLLAGCGKESKMQTVITRAEKAIKQMQDDEITIKELAEKLENISDYCEAYEDTDEHGSTLCVSITLYEYEATMSNASPTKGIDYKYWDEALEELNRYRDWVE